MSFGAWIKAKMSLDSSGVKVGVASAKNEVNGFKTQLGGLGMSLTKAFGAAAIVSSVAKFTQGAIEMAIRTKEIADQAGLTVEQLQAFSAEAMQVTGGLQAASVGLVAFRTAQQEALDGNEATIKAFGRLGISLEDIANKSTPQLLEAVAKGYKSVGDFGALVDLFGKKNAGKLEEALIALADSGFGGLEKKARDAGMVLGDEFSAQLDQVGDAMDRLKLKMQVGWDKILVGAFNALRKLEAWRKGMVAYAGSFLADMWDPSVALSPAKVIDAARNAEQAGQAAQSKELEKQKNDDKLFRQERSQQKQKTEDREAALRKSKIADIYAKEAEEAKKLDEKKATLAEKAAEKAAADATKETDRLAKIEAGTTVREIGAPEASAARARYDSLREIGANILGSGRIGGTPADRNAEIARATRQTAENTAIIAEKLNSPAVSRIADAVAVY